MVSTVKPEKLESVSAQDMANTIFGPTVAVISASYTGAAHSAKLLTNDEAPLADGAASNSGVILSTSALPTLDAPNDSLSDGTGAPMQVAAFIDTDIIPEDDIVALQFVYSSENVPDETGSIFDDMLGIWVNGTPLDVVIGNGQISPEAGSSSAGPLATDQAGTVYSSETDGFTATMTAKMAVIPGEVNSIRVGIASAAGNPNSPKVKITEVSKQGEPIANDDSVTLGPDGSTTIDVTANDIAPGQTGIFVTHINGIAVDVGDTVTLSTGQTITLNADGTLTITADADIESVGFTYTVATGGGASINADTGNVTIDTVPCFVAGTMIETISGLVAVENLVPGDMVLTVDNGVQPLRWVGCRVVPAEGNFAPIHIAKNTFGKHDSLFLSPQHRVLIRDVLAELLFENSEVLVAAKDLVNGSSVQVIEGGQVEYVHILFDAHEVVFSGGLATESFLPGPQTSASFETDIVNEITALFPELDPELGTGYPRAARRILKGYEARVLLANGIAA